MAHMGQGGQGTGRRRAAGEISAGPQGDGEGKRGHLGMAEREGGWKMAAGYGGGEMVARRGEETPGRQRGDLGGFYVEGRAAPVEEGVGDKDGVALDIGPSEVEAPGNLVEHGHQESVSPRGGNFLLQLGELLLHADARPLEGVDLERGCWGRWAIRPPHAVNEVPTIDGDEVAALCLQRMGKSCGEGSVSGGE